MDYMPCMRWKSGEKEALVKLKGVSSKFRPLIFVKDEEMYVKLIAELNSIWAYSCVIDLSRVAITQSQLDQCASTIAIAEVRRSIALSVPQISAFDLSKIYENQLDIIVRLDVSDDAESIVDRHHELNNICNQRAIQFSSISVIIDLGASVNDVSVDGLKNSFRSISATDAREIYFAGGNFPTAFADIGSGFAKNPRSEYALWSEISADSPTIGYADYTVVSPSWKPVSGGGSSPALLRYTYTDYWLILRNPVSNADVSYSLSDLLVNVYPEYMGKSYSWADEIWWNRSQVIRPSTPSEKKKVPPGNSTKHISEGIGHHIMYVLKSDLGVVQ